MHVHTCTHTHTIVTKWQFYLSGCYWSLRTYLSGNLCTAFSNKNHKQQSQRRRGGAVISATVVFCSSQEPLVWPMEKGGLKFCELNLQVVFQNTGFQHVLIYQPQYLSLRTCLLSWVVLRILICQNVYTYSCRREQCHSWGRTGAGALPSVDLTQSGSAVGQLWCWKHVWQFQNPKVSWFCRVPRIEKHKRCSWPT